MSIKGIGINLDASTVDGDYHLFAQQLKFFQETGFDYVEIPVHGLDLIINGRLNQKQLRKTKELMSSFDFRYTIHAPDDLNLMAALDPEVHLEVFKSTIRFAAEVGAEIIVYHSSIAFFEPANLVNYYIPKYGQLPEGEIFSKLKQEEILCLQELADLAREAGVTICLENNWVLNPQTEYTYGIYAETLIEHVKKINRPNVGIVYDFGHGYIASKLFNFDFLAAVSAITPWIQHLHVHDNFGKLDHGERNIQRIPFGRGDLHLPVGWGEIPYGEVFKLLKNYSGTLTLEIQPRFADYLKENLSQIKKMFV